MMATQIQNQILFQNWSKHLRLKDRILKLYKTDLPE